MEVLKPLYGSVGNREVFREEGQLVRGRRGASSVWEPLAVSEFSGCQKHGASWSEGCPK